MPGSNTLPFVSLGNSTLVLETEMKIYSFFYLEAKTFLGQKQGIE